MDVDECPCSGKTLGRLVQPAILALLNRQPLHGYLLVRRLGEMEMFRCGGPPDAAGVYRLLRTMEESKLVVASWDPGDAGPAKRRFELTAEGKACLACWHGTLVQYARSIEDLLGAIGHTGRRPRKKAAS